MSAITGDALGTYGAPYADYGTSQIDPTTDCPAASGNKMFAAVSGMTVTRFQTWAKFLPAGTGAPTLVAHRELWLNSGLAVPVVARSGVGIYTLTYPANVQDEIPLGFAGYTGPVGTNLLAGYGSADSTTTFWGVNVVASANVLTVYLFTGGASLADPNGPNIYVWGF